MNHAEAVSLLVDAEPKTLKETNSIIDASKNGLFCKFLLSLCMLCSIGRTEIVETLLDAGMDPNCFDGKSGKGSAYLIKT